MEIARVGFGYDVHQLKEGNPLILGGVNIPYYKGCVAHSDGDVLIHAIIDAILGAASLGNIGVLFPDNDPQFKNISSFILLDKTISLIENEGFSIANIDSTVVLQEPKISTYFDQMKNNVAKSCHLNYDQVSIKATTNEFMGFIGRGEGIGAYAVCLLQK